MSPSATREREMNSEPSAYSRSAVLRRFAGIQWALTSTCIEFDRWIGTDIHNTNHFYSWKDRHCKPNRCAENGHMKGGKIQFLKLSRPAVSKRNLPIKHKLFQEQMSGNDTAYKTQSNLREMRCKKKCKRVSPYCKHPLASTGIGLTLGGWLWYFFEQHMIFQGGTQQPHDALEGS